MSPQDRATSTSGRRSTNSGASSAPGKGSPSLRHSYEDSPGRLGYFAQGLGISLAVENLSIPRVSIALALRRVKVKTKGLLEEAFDRPPRA